MLRRRSSARELHLAARGARRRAVGAVAAAASAERAAAHRAARATSSRRELRRLGTALHAGIVAAAAAVRRLWAAHWPPQLPAATRIRSLDRMRVRGDGLDRSANDRLYAYNPSVARWRTRAEPRALRRAARATNHHNCVFNNDAAPARDRRGSGCSRSCSSTPISARCRQPKRCSTFRTTLRRLRRPARADPVARARRTASTTRLHAGDALHISCNRGVVATLSIRRRDGRGDGGGPLRCAARVFPRRRRRRRGHERGSRRPAAPSSTRSPPLAA